LPDASTKKVTNCGHKRIQIDLAQFCEVYLRQITTLWKIYYSYQCLKIFYMI